jgi:hypothetical protein
LLLLLTVGSVVDGNDWGWFGGVDVGWLGWKFKTGLEGSYIGWDGSSGCNVLPLSEGGIEGGGGIDMVSFVIVGIWSMLFLFIKGLIAGLPLDVIGTLLVLVERVGLCGMIVLDIPLCWGKGDTGLSSTVPPSSFLLISPLSLSTDNSRFIPSLRGGYCVTIGVIVAVCCLMYPSACKNGFLNCCGWNWGWDVGCVWTIFVSMPILPGRISITGVLVLPFIAVGTFAVTSGTVCIIGGIVPPVLEIMCGWLGVVCTTVGWDTWATAGWTEFVCRTVGAWITVIELPWTMVFPAPWALSGRAIWSTAIPWELPGLTGLIIILFITCCGSTCIGVVFLWSTVAGWDRGIDVLCSCSRFFVLFDADKFSLAEGGSGGFRGVPAFLFYFDVLADRCGCFSC